MVQCECGHTYEDSCKFCPECATPNPNPVNVRKKFRKVGEGELNKPASSEDNTAEEESIETPKTSSKLTPDTPVVKETHTVKRPPVIEEDEDDEDEDYDNDEEDEDDEYDKDEEEDEDDYEPAPPVKKKPSTPPPSPKKRPQFEDEDDDEEDDYEDEDEDEDEEDYEDYAEVVAPVKKPKSKPIKSSLASEKKPQAKTVKAASSEKKKKKVSYDPNFDGYYDDRLPAILDEITKTSHIDVFLKIGLAVVCIVAIIVYCIFYVNI